MNPYKIDIKKLIKSEVITSEEDILKYRLRAEFVRISENINSQDILKKTGLHKADLSRLRSGDIGRFSISRIIKLLADLGYTTHIKVSKKKAS